MRPQTIFQINLVLGYVAWLLCFRVYLLPRLKRMERFEAHRAIATLHSFRFIGLAFILPGVAGYHLPAGFAYFAAYVDLAAGVLALMALASVKVRPLYWFFIVAFNVVGITDLIMDNFHAMRSGVPAVAGELGSTYAIIILLVPLLVITHCAALYWLIRDRSAAGPASQAAAV